jgi:hypothetical protein
MKDKHGCKGHHNRYEKEWQQEVVNQIIKHPRYISHYSRASKNDKLVPTEANCQ